MVYDIASGLARDNQVDMLLLNCQYDEFDKDKIHFLSNNKRKTLSGIVRIGSMPKLISLVFKYKMSIGSLIRLAYQWSLMGYLDKMLRDGKYDVVHIHGCSYINIFIIDLCKKRNVKFVITFHGLNSFDDSVKLEAAGKQFEKDFLTMAYQNKWTLTFISTGMKKRVMEYLNTDCADNIHVICNSFNFKKNNPDDIDIREKYGIPPHAKIILYVGNQGENKNQKQMVRSFSLLDDRMQEQTYVMFLGAVNEEYNLRKEIEKLTYSHHLIICGAVPKELVAAYYKQADATALFSISEGFGLSLVEGMSYGLPCIAIKTMDAFEDIYSPECMVGVEKHDDQLIADGMAKLLTHAWNSEKIRKHADRFTNEFMTERYTQVFKS